jgi:hypothetical protein
MENQFVISRIRKQGKQKIVSVDVKNNLFNIGDEVLIQKINIKPIQEQLKTESESDVLLQTNG